MNIEFEGMNEFCIDINKPSKPYAMPVRHYHNCYEIYIITKGNRIIMVNDERFCGNCGDVFLIPPGKVHHTSGMKYERIVLYFSEQFLSGFFADVFLKKLLRCFETTSIKMSKNFEKIEEICTVLSKATEKGNRDVIAVKLAELLLLLHDNKDNIIEKQEDKNVGYMVADILDFIGENYSSIENIEEISKMFLISREYLCKIFKKQTGVTVITYINTLKLEKARRMISSTNKKITEIVSECGYSSATYFGKLFIKKYGVSPREFRKNVRNKNIMDKNLDEDFYE